MSTGDLVNRGGLESSGGLLSRGDPATGVGPWSICGPWSTDDLGRCGGPVEEGAPGTEGVLRTGAVRPRGSCLRTGTYH